MHKIAEKIADCLKAKVEGMGIDNINGQDLVEFELWSKIIKNLVCYDKDKKIIEAMDEAEEAEEAMKYIEMYENYPEERKGYRGQPRNSKGQFMSRRGYESRMMPEMDYDEMERTRDFDRESGKMYYGGSGSMGGSQESIRNYNGSNYSSGNQQTSRSENARRGYEESKMMQDGSPESKKKAMESLENYMKELGEDMSELIGKMDSNEKSMLRSKLQMLAQRVQ